MLILFINILTSVSCSAIVPANLSAWRNYELQKNRCQPSLLLLKCFLLQKWFRIDSDPVKNNIPHYGLKEHASVDTRYGFVLATEVTPQLPHK